MSIGLWVMILRFLDSDNKFFKVGKGKWRDTIRIGIVGTNKTFNNYPRDWKLKKPGAKVIKPF